MNWLIQQTEMTCKIGEVIKVCCTSGANSTHSGRDMNTLRTTVTNVYSDVLDISVIPEISVIHMSLTHLL